MTTKVRIEKADSTPYIIMMQVEMANHEGKWVPEGSPHPIQYPAQLIEEHLHQGKRLVVYELERGNV